MVVDFTPARAGVVAELSVMELYVHTDFAG
jgi:hypothetical protein